MVMSVAAVSETAKAKRDNRQTSYSEPRQGESGGKSGAKRQSTPLECYTTTYGRDSMVQTFHYQSREYSY